MSAALIEAARDALEAWDSLPRKTYSLSTSVSEWLEYRMAPTIARLRTALAAAEQPAEPVPTGWDGTEEWEALAWHLCAEENGEDACNELVWEGGPMPEPWGDRWLKYEGPAKDMIAKVRKFASPAAPAQAPTDEFVYRVVRSVQPHLDDTCKAWGQEFAQCKYWLDAAHGIGSKA